MKLNVLNLLVTLLVSVLSFAQVANQPSDLVVCDNDNDGFAQFNLNVLDAEVLGEQDPADYTISYHLTQSDATNGINSLFSPFFNSSPNAQTIFIRLSDNTSGNADTTTADLIVNASPDAGFNGTVELCSNSSSLDLFSILGGTPQVGGSWFPSLGSGTSIFNPSIDVSGTYTYMVAGSAPCSDDFALVTVTVNSINISIVDITYCIGETVTIATGLNTANYSFEWTLNDVLLPNEVQASVIATQPGTYSVTVMDLSTGCIASSTAILDEVDCTDTDDDGVIDSDEDINENGNLNDDDTDKDTIPNYLDDDDDGDNVDTLTEISISNGRGNNTHVFIDTDEDMIENYLDDDDDGDNVLTIDEDYNNNGDPTDDDTNMNSIPDYLDSAVALSLSDFDVFNFQMYPNPARTILTVKLNTYDRENIILSIIDLQGKQILVHESIDNTVIQVNISSLKSGLYFVKIGSGSNNQIKKLVVH